MTSRAGIRLFVDGPLIPRGRLPMTDTHSHYLRNVLRRAAGDDVRLFNGRDGEWRARIDTLDKRGGAFAIEAQTRAQTREDGPWLLIATIKRARLELIVEKATELGVSCIRPITTTRTNVERINRDRLISIAVEAAEQCSRLTVPEIAAPQPLSEVLRDWSPQRRLYLLDETGGGTPIAASFAAHPAHTEAALLVGPEGGFDQTELDAMINLPFVNALDLGGRVLRAETAALAALSCYQAIAGDWARNQGRPPDQPAAAP